MMERVRPWLDLIRFHEYGPFAILSCIVGALLATPSIDARAIHLSLFAVASSMSAFVANDLADVEEDRLKGKMRNPIASGRLRATSAYLAFALLAASSVFLLISLSGELVPLGLLVLALCWGYSWGPRLKDKPIVATLVHGAVPALFAVMGYALYSPVSASPVLLSLILLALSAMSDILQGIRDLEADSSLRRTTVAILGVRRSVDAAIALMVAAAAAYALMVALGFLPWPLIAFVPLAYVLIDPLLKLRSGGRTASQTIEALRLRGLALAAALIAAYLILEAL